VPDNARDEAYADEALPIAAGQTISQPYMVARMTELLDVQPAPGSGRW
jgi:protein-L-isoaspartate(D-aspartate) O-methyltransferase